MKPIGREWEWYCGEIGIPIVDNVTGDSGLLNPLITNFCAVE